MQIQDALGLLLEKQNLNAGQMSAVMHQVMGGEATDAQIGGFLIALRMKGESVDEVAAAAQVMRQLATPVSVNQDSLVDIVGTGGDSSSTFNISTCCAIVCAAAGARVAKHGNRAVSSKSGAADLLEQAGVNISLTPEQVAGCIDQLGLGFMFAPRHHSAMKYAIGPRKEMGVRTLFNLLGPLTNPAGARHQLLGVYDLQWVRPMAEVLAKLGSEHVIVVHGHGGMDEISLSGPSRVAQLKNGQIEEYDLDPSQYGFECTPIERIMVSGPEESLAMIHSVLNDRPGPARDIVALNAGAALCAAGISESVKTGIETALSTIASGQAKQKLSDLIEFTAAMA